MKKLIMASLLVLASLNLASPAPIPVQYGTANDGTPLHWQVVSPDGGGRHPVVLLFEAGQFKHLNNIPPIVAHTLAQAGYLVFTNVEYRIAPPNKLPGQVTDGHFPDQTNDCALAAAAALADNRCNGEVFTVGGSAGASHAMYLAANSLVKAAVCFSPPTQFDDPFSLQDPNFSFAVNNYAPNNLAAASPNNMLVANESPILIVAFAQDHIPAPQFTLAVNKLDSLGAPYESKLLPGDGHAWDCWFVSGVPEQVISFLDAHR